MRPALSSLTLAAFGIGTTEFVVMGLLPSLAHALHISVPDAGRLVSAYALGVVVGAPLLTLAARRLPAKTTLLSLMGLFTLGNAATALAPDEPVLLVTRFVAGLPHGAFFGVGAVVAAGMVSADRTAKAVSTMFLGLALANIAGVPLGTYLGTTLGWRWTFAVVAAIGAFSLIAIALMIPRHEPHGRAAVPVGVREELAVFRRGDVWLALGTVTVGFASVFTVYSYVAPLLTEAAGFSPTSVSALLVLLGVGMTVGNILGGRAADRALIPSLYAALAALAVVLVLFALALPVKAAATVGLFATGVTGFSLGPIMQTYAMSKAPGSTSLISASVQSAFNIANSLGAYLGGLALSAGLGYPAPVWLGAALALLGLTLAVMVTTATRRRT
ncbi:MFS transporter [Streptomyces sp. NPDC001793]|uniref:MFS transporter n=1 Tax=Streptomyces sp. NPDC001793 TaxID=3154657 RepID=UPI003333A079